MEKYNYIAVSEFCASHGISSEFILELHEYGLIEIIEEKDAHYLLYTELPKAEKIIRLYSDLDINLEGIEVIHDLLDRIERMQNEIISLKNKLRFYE
ncbi:chaperone modulator CbpM [Maribacter polysaccharolyticus]|uniref:chaperone modulator CbpM n=1 Tax=Maribacter polysaccharolyticus TaxID=3020831 RepID=UPI00237FC28F|nr:chaperone modulator CbpM [Maribacter polysaccharolyticus]MDE3740847.1 chaperone modulator CbpM [Maribacter polysaccharolyticus]